MTTAVSGATHILVHGSILEDGRPVESGNKHKTAMALRGGLKLDGKPTKPHYVEIVSEEEFFKLYPVEKESQSQSAETAVSLATPIVPRNGDNAATANKGLRDDRLWAEKWRPERVEDILGNGEAIKKLAAWLKDWHDVCMLGNKKEALKSRWGDGEKVSSSTTSCSNSSSEKLSSHRWFQLGIPHPLSMFCSFNSLVVCSQCSNNNGTSAKTVNDIV